MSNKQTTQQWLEDVKSSTDKMTHWLQRQYIGEDLAAHRISELVESVGDSRWGKVLHKIADDEAKHRDWIGELLINRNIPLPSSSIEGTRYWKPILNNLTSFEEIAGAGHHAEAMRLVRIRAIVQDSEIDADIREIFTKILPDEEFHSKAFEAMSNSESLEKTSHLHHAGLEILGLEL